MFLSLQADQPINEIPISDPFVFIEMQSDTTFD